MPNVTRRDLLRKGAGAALLASELALIPSVFTLVGAPPAALASDDVSDDTPPAPSAAFLSLSRTLTGFEVPDALLAARLYAELDAAHAGLEAKLTAIAGAVAQATGGKLDTFADAALEAVHRDLMTGWYLGTVGPADNARCIAFENIASYRVVKKTLLPPSYAVGEPNFWVSKPEV